MKYLLSLVLALALIACNGCSQGPYKRIAIAYKVGMELKPVVESVDRSFKTWGALEHRRCAVAHKVKTPEYNKCVDPAYKLLKQWSKVLPTIQSGQYAYKKSLDAAFDFVKKNEKKCGKKDAPKDCKPDYLALKPGGCALIEIVDRGIKLGAYQTSKNDIYLMAKGALLSLFKCGQ